MKQLLAVFSSCALAAATHAAGLPPIQTVFIIVLENHNWSAIQNSTNAPYINGTLLPRASYCEQYYNPPGIHPSEPNYLWLEAGTNFGILNDNDPAANHQNSPHHLTAQLRQAGIPWKTYQEDIPGTVVPLTAVNGYAPKHDPFIYFDDVTGTNNANDAYGIAHNRPYAELAGDLASNRVARYNFITPNLCDDGHDSCAPQSNPVRQSDDWLASEVPKILNSAAYTNHGVLFITWDEATSGDGPIGMIVLSPLARGGGYFNNIHYTHSSYLRTVQEIFGVTPLLGDAVKATDLGDLFSPFAITPAGVSTNGSFQMSVSGVVPGRTNYLEASTNLVTWQIISTNASSSNSFNVVDNSATNNDMRFYRVQEAP